ncbi:MAG: hemerythrin domain-containing protein [Bdellovibrio bacteriovorus]
MPESIAVSLTADHRRCDRLLALAEAATSAVDWDRVASETQGFAHALERHLRFEEETLFPALEAAVPMAAGPTGVMRMEHGQMRQMLADLLAASRVRDKDDCLGLLETLHLVIQQHNAKEESILYPMADRALAAEAPELLASLGE